METTIITKKVEITKIEIKIGEKVISLTPEEAEELRCILNANFGKKGYVPYPYPIYDRWPYKYWEPIITYTGTSNDYVATLSTTTQEVPILETPRA